MADGKRAAQRAETFALAVINGDASMSDVREGLRLALREREVTRDSQALRAYRQGGEVWAWPSVAPHAGF